MVIDDPEAKARWCPKLRHQFFRTLTTSGAGPEAAVAA
jgi:hypothetical protein